LNTPNFFWGVFYFYKSKAEIEKAGQKRKAKGKILGFCYAAK